MFKGESTFSFQVYFWQIQRVERLSNKNMGIDSYFPIILWPHTVTVASENGLS